MSVGDYIRKYRSILTEEMIKDLRGMVEQERANAEHIERVYPRGEGG